jgi:hypothetical protein
MKALRIDARVLKGWWHCDGLQNNFCNKIYNPLFDASDIIKVAAYVVSFFLYPMKKYNGILTLLTYAG